MYTRTGSTWNLEQTLLASDGATLDGFGWSLALENETLAGGSIGDDDVIPRIVVEINQ